MPVPPGRGPVLHAHYFSMYTFALNDFCQFMDYVYSMTLRALSLELTLP